MEFAVSAHYLFNIRSFPDAYLISQQRWPTIKPTLCQSIGFAGLFHNPIAYLTHFYTQMKIPFLSCTIIHRGKLIRHRMCLSHNTITR